MTTKWIPKQSKFNRLHKSRIKEVEYSRPHTTLAFGHFGVQVLKNGRLTGDQLEATRRIVSKFVRKKETLWIRSIPTYPLTAKPAQIRMGKGKGDVNGWVFRMESGKILLELGRISFHKALRLFRSAVKKLGVPCRLITRLRLFKKK